MNTGAPATTAHVLPVVVAGNRTVHAGRAIGTYPSGATRYAKRCSGAGRDRHEPMLAEGAKVTCKRCLAKLAALEESRAAGFRKLAADGARRDPLAGKVTRSAL